jgi:DNA-binding transcriptional regulator LsrR (DeoR family)
MEEAWGKTPFQENEAAALQLYYSDGLTQNKLADRLGMSQEAARKLLNRALSRVGDQINGGVIPEVSARLAEPELERVHLEEA